MKICFWSHPLGLSYEKQTSMPIEDKAYIYGSGNKVWRKWVLIPMQGTNREWDYRAQAWN
jgi:hypothetical protein